ncbi:hypothetical protein DRO58_04510 [Candidatus Bathyarchaeota archaeon]|nr:MAG: hypothetical protein DRO58_04510 [Candidatus Bathyarchaeota archaeon]
MKSSGGEPSIRVLEVVAKAETPLHVGTGRHYGVVKECRPYIPGSFLRGAFGTALIKVCCVKPEYIDNHSECPSREECPYFRLFRDEGNKASRIIFRHAYPRHVGCFGGGVYLPAPRNLYTCRSMHTRRYSFEPLETVCEECKERLEPFRGYVCSSCGTLTKSPVRFQRIAYTALDRSKGSAAIILHIPGTEPYGTLHSVDVIPRGFEFQTHVTLSKDVMDLTELVVKVLETAVPDEGLGGSKSRGLGKVSLRVKKVSDVTSGDVEARASELDSENFTVRLLSDAFLKEPLLKPETLLAYARRAYTWVYRKGAPSLPDVKLDAWVVSTGVMGGWSLRDGRRRSIRPIVEAGAVYRYVSTGSEELSKALAALEYLAVGGFKAHGYGQVRIEHF